MNQTYLEKTKEEQESDFRIYFQPYADITCKICHGTGKRSWMVDLQQYIPCECVMINLEKEKRKQESLITRVTEVIN